MNRKIFAYCERGLDPAFWAEPVNAITNAAFIIAALVATWHWLRLPAAARGPVEACLIALIYAMGIGSFLFHTFATPWAALADTIPIGIFMVAYLAYALKRYLGLGWLITFALLVLFFISLWQSSVARCDGGPCFNGSLAYAPALVVLLVIGSILFVRKHPAGLSLFAAGAIFALSLTFRTMDQTACSETVLPTGRPLGLHFMWHVLNATLLYVLVRAALLYGTATVPASKPADSP